MSDLKKRFKEKKDSFGWNVAIHSSVAALYPFPKHGTALSWSLLQNKHEAILKYLERKYDYVIKRHEQNHACDIDNTRKIIWAMWWQGVDSLPETIKMCHESVRKHAKGYEYIVITKHNIKDYIELPNHIIEKVNAGIISLTHLSDIVRYSLLNQYGGMWLDSAIFVAKDIPNKIFEMPYFTAKLAPKRMFCVSQAKWCGGILAGQKGNPFFEYMSDFFSEYWKHENSLIEYWLIDYVTEIAYRNFGYFRTMLDSVPKNNAGYLALESMLNDPWNEPAWEKMKEATTFFALTWKHKYVRTQPDKMGGGYTFFGHFAEEYLPETK